LGRFCIIDKKEAPGLAQYHKTKVQIEEEQLQILAAQKNPRRFGVIYERYYEQIFLFVLKRVGDEDPAADVTSQVFLKALTHLKNYTFKGLPFSSWLYRISVNEVNQYFRQTKATRTISVESVDLLHILEEAETSAGDENIKRMLLALDTLSSDEVQMVEFRYFEKMPFREVAGIYKITENNAKVRMYRILNKIKKRIAELENEQNV
jgi:RNA polymerase sigma-70 factor (ECF subfamily)